MEIEISKEKDTPLLSRKRVTAWAYYEGATPSRKVVLKEFAKKVKADPKNTVIKHIYTRFGQTDMKIIANVYNDRQTLERLESKNMIEKNKVEEEKPAETEEKPTEKTEEAAEEKPTKEAKTEETTEKTEEAKEE